MSPALKSNPIEIPEILHLVGSHLSEHDVKTCMEVSKTWNELFCGYRWHHLYYSRNGIPHLDKYGHLVRSLHCFYVTEEDLRIMAGYCHLVQTLRLELRPELVMLNLEILTSNMPFIQDLTLEFSHRFSIEHWMAIAQLKHLRLLCLSAGRSTNSHVDMAMLTHVFNQCPSIISLKLKGQFLTINATPSRPQTPSRITILAQPDENVVKRWLRQRLYPHEFNPAIPTPAIKSKEPWRKFVSYPVMTPAQWTSQSLEAQPTHPPRLTRLCLEGISSSLLDKRPLSLLLKKAPYVEDLSLEFTKLEPALVAEFLDGIDETCHQVRVLKLDGLQRHPLTMKSINQFFQRQRSTLTDLTVKNCQDIESVFELIPDLTAAGLEKITLDGSLDTPKALHQLMRRCLALKSFAWNCPHERRFRVWTTHPNAMGMLRISPITPPIDLPLQLDTMPEPWGCYETIRSLEQTFGFTTTESMDAYFSRLKEMRQLVSLGTLLCDLRQLLAHAHEFTDDDLTLEYVLVEKTKDDNGENNPNPSNRWCLPSIQELTLSSLIDWRVSAGSFNAAPNEIDAHMALDQEEVEQILQVFPSLKKINYRGYWYPLESKARTWLLEESNRDISVLHVPLLSHSYFL